MRREILGGPLLHFRFLVGKTFIICMTMYVYLRINDNKSASVCVRVFNSWSVSVREIVNLV